MLYSNGLRDITSGKYDLARQEFQDYLKYYSDTDLASNAQFYLGEIAYSQKRYQEAVSEYDKVLTVYPKSFKLAPARLKKGMALLELGQKTSGVRELREVVRRYPGTEEERRARARLKELGAAVTVGDCQIPPARSLNPRLLASSTTATLRLITPTSSGRFSLTSSGTLRPSIQFRDCAPHNHFRKRLAEPPSSPHLRHPNSPGVSALFALAVFR
jgi:tol-pal system protein YbgF